MKALHELVNLIDEIKENITSDQYLRMMDLTKVIDHHVLDEERMINISGFSRCYEHGPFCICNANRRVGFMMDEMVVIPKYLKTIAAMAEAIHLDQD